MSEAVSLKLQCLCVFVWVCRCVENNILVFVLSQMSPRCANLALKHYLLKPVQRIPQYQLLLTGTNILTHFHVFFRLFFKLCMPKVKGLFDYGALCLTGVKETN